MFEVRWRFCKEVATLHRGVTYQSDGKDLADGVEYLYRGAKLPYRPGFKRQLMFQDVTAKYCIYDKLLSLPMSFFV